MSGLTPPPWPSYQYRTVESQPTASRLLPPSPRRERGAGAASVSGCLSFWQSTLPRETARSPQHLSLAFRGALAVCSPASPDILKRNEEIPPSARGAACCWIPPAEDERKDRETQNTVRYDRRAAPRSLSRVRLLKTSLTSSRTRKLVGLYLELEKNSPFGSALTPRVSAAQRLLQEVWLRAEQKNVPATEVEISGCF